MKKYLITLAAVSMAIGGAINFTGCAPDGSNLEGPTTEGEPEGKSEEELNKEEAAKKTGGGDAPEEKK